MTAAEALRSAARVPLPARGPAAVRAGRPSPVAKLAALLVGELTHASPLLKQLSITVLFALALVLCVAKNAIVVVDVGAVTAGGVVMAGATALAAALSARRPAAALLGVLSFEHLSNLVIAADFLAVAALRHGTGDGRSIFGVLSLIPSLWIAGNTGRRYIAYTSAGAVVVYLLPLMLPGALQLDPTGPYRAAYVVLANTVAAGVINELARQGRRQFVLSREQQAAVKRDILRGAKVQRALLPGAESPLAAYEVAGACLPATMVGGDFYDWYPTADGMGFTLGDVMGKGVGAGMIAATARAVIRSARDEPDPVAALVRADASLTTDLGDIGSFATVFHARVDAVGGRVRYADAGHGLTLHVRARGGWERLRSSGMPLGVGFGSSWCSGELTLDEGDLLVSFSDGVLDFHGGSLGALDYLALIARGARSADELVEAIVQLARSIEHDDDVTVVVMRRRSDLTYDI